MVTKHRQTTQICTFEEFEKFKSIYDRLERLSSLSEFERIDLADDLQAFSPTYIRISFHMGPKLREDLVAGAKACIQKDLKALEESIRGDITIILPKGISAEAEPEFLQRLETEHYHRAEISKRAFHRLWRELSKQFSKQKGRDKRVKTKQWTPPKGYIGSKEIFSNYGVPRSTLEGWRQRDEANYELDKPIKKNPQTNENYYPQKWFQERLKSYRPRKQA